MPFNDVLGQQKVFLKTFGKIFRFLYRSFVSKESEIYIYIYI